MPHYTSCLPEIESLYEELQRALAEAAAVEAEYKKAKDAINPLEELVLELRRHVSELMAHFQQTTDGRIRIPAKANLKVSNRGVSMLGPHPEVEKRPYHASIQSKVEAMRKRTYTARAFG